MPGNNYVVFKNLRPPVCIDSTDNMPLNSTLAKRTFSVVDKKKGLGVKIIKRNIVS